MDIEVFGPPQWMGGVIPLRTTNAKGSTRTLLTVSIDININIILFKITITKVDYMGYCVDNTVDGDELAGQAMEGDMFV